MKKNCLVLGGILLISLLSTLVFSACDKDTWCYLEVSVKDLKGNIQGDAHVRISMQGTIEDIGATNANGVYTTKFAAPARIPSTPTSPTSSRVSSLSA